MFGNESCEVKLPNGAHSKIGKIIIKLSSETNLEQEAQKSGFENKNLEIDKFVDKRSDNDKLLPLEKPFKREYILRSSVPRPAPYSRQSPQRLYRLMSNIEFRLAGAFTEDTMFF